MLPVKYKAAELAVLADDESFVALPEGSGDVDRAARSILRLCRASERDLGEGSSSTPLVQLESETDLRAAETLQDRGFGTVESRRTGLRDKVGRFAVGWFFIASQKG